MKLDTGRKKTKRFFLEKQERKPRKMPQLVCKRKKKVL